MPRLHKGQVSSVSCRLLPCDSTIQVWCKVLSEDTSKGCKCINELAVVPPKHCSHRHTPDHTFKEELCRAQDPATPTSLRRSKRSCRQDKASPKQFLKPSVQLQGPDDSGSGDESSSKAKHEDQG